MKSFTVNLGTSFWLSNGHVGENVQVQNVPDLLLQILSLISRADFDAALLLLLLPLKTGDGHKRLTRVILYSADVKRNRSTVT